MFTAVAAVTARGRRFAMAILIEGRRTSREAAPACSGTGGLGKRLFNPPLK
jgi:hypothetical protein